MLIKKALSDLNVLALITKMINFLKSDIGGINISLLKDDLKLKEYEMLVDLLNNGLKLDEALEIIKNKNNTSIIESIISKLKAGIGISEILLTSKSVHPHFVFFEKQMELPKAIIKCLDLVKYEKSIINDLLKKIAYPAMILFTAAICLSFCAYFVLPTLLSVLNDLDVSMPFFLILFLKLFTVLLTLLIIAIVLVFMGLLMVMRLNDFEILYTLLCKIKCEKIFKSAFSYYFAGYYLELLKYDHQTFRHFDLLSKMHYKPLTAKVASLINSYLLNGDDLHLALSKIEYISEALNTNIKIGIKSGCLENYLKQYLNTMQIKINQYTSNIVLFCKLLSYSSVGLVILIMSQLLFSPLEMMANL